MTEEEKRRRIIVEFKENSIEVEFDNWQLIKGKDLERAIRAITRQRAYLKKVAIREVRIAKEKENGR